MECYHLNNFNLVLNVWNAGIEPTWEDPNNAKGGKWIVRLKKGLASRYWEEILLALLGEQFTGIPHDEICGAVVSCRYNEDILSVWNRSATNRDITDRVRESIKRILRLPPTASLLGPPAPPQYGPKAARCPRSCPRQLGRE